jgi:hypothetical protein
MFVFQLQFSRGAVHGGFFSRQRFLVEFWALCTDSLLRLLLHSRVARVINHISEYAGARKLMHLPCFEANKPTLPACSKVLQKLLNTQFRESILPHNHALVGRRLCGTRYCSSLW